MAINREKSVAGGCKRKHKKPAPEQANSPPLTMMQQARRDWTGSAQSDSGEDPEQHNNSE